jgi:hypothetical protein
LHKSFAVIFALLSWPLAAHANAGSFGVFSLNIAWYGLGGSIDGHPHKEHRDEDLASLLDDAFSRHHVGVFEEIVDVERFIRRVVPDTAGCQSYDHPVERHQHVVVCVKHPFRFEATVSAPAFTWDDVAVGQTRPALVGRVVDRDGNEVLNLVAVHLKSSPDFSHVRKQQVQIIATHIRKELAKTGTPVLVTGDFNTFGSDHEMIKKELSKSGLAFEELRSHALHTFSNRRYQNKFDRIFFAGSLHPETLTMVRGPCNMFEANRHEDFSSRTPLEDLDEWNQRISDHCMIHATFKLPGHIN